MSEKFMPVRVSTLRGDVKIKFNVYVKVAGKQILLCREGDSFEGERLERLRGKKLSRIFIPAEQQTAYEEYLLRNMEGAFSGGDGRPAEMRLQIAHGLLHAATEDIMESPADRTYFEVFKLSAERFVKLFSSEPAALNVFLELKNADFNVAHHAVTVAALSLGIAREMPSAEGRALQMVPMVMGALLHDIEHTYNDTNFAVAASHLAQAEKPLHKKHAMAGYERLNATGLYDPLTLIVVSEHEEYIDGSGPRGKRDRDLDLLSMIVSTANAFDHYLLYENLTPKEALKKMLIEKMGLLHLEAMRGLQEALKKRGII